MKQHLIYLIGLLMLPIFLQAQGPNLEFNSFKKAQITNDNFVLHYRILYPEDFDKNRKYPIILFLHGSGERGNDNESQLNHGGSFFLNKEHRKNFPAIVVFPQCPSSDSWTTFKRHNNIAQTSEPMQTKSLQTVIKLVKQLREENYVDESRIYVGGLSLGGMGTFEILRNEPNLFAAAFPICGADDIKNVETYKHIPLWVFHGDKDAIVLPEFSINIVNRLKELGATPKFTLYPGVEHNSWDLVFQEKDLLPWLFSNSR